MPELIDRLQQSYQVFAPVERRGLVLFERIEGGDAAAWSFRNTRLSPKGLFLPQTQPMFSFVLDNRRTDAHTLRPCFDDQNPRVVLAIRPCDARALELVDVNFNTPQYQDPWWVRTRQTTTLVGLGCTKPCSTCFCTSVGGGPFDTTGLDVLLTELDDGFVARPITKKGHDLVQAAGPLPTAEPDLVQRARMVERNARDLITVKLDTSRLSGMDMLGLYEADFWDAVQFACINCGTCTYLCPTCWCFDIQDEAYAKAGVRMRNWDSCMFALFTRHASGHNPRGEKLQRVRQRFMHKLKYYVDRYGKGVACVGCGRCVRHCPVNIDIREVIRMMNACGA